MHPQRFRSPRVVLSLCLFASLSVVAHQARAAVHVYGCVLNGRQVATPVASSALGGGQFVVDTDANTMTFRIAYTGLNSPETAAHIHGFSDPGVNAGVLFGLPAGSPKVGVWNYAEVDEADILAGRTYVNIHTSTSPGGEIRGQIVPFNALLDGAQAGVASSGTGWGTFTIDTNTNQLNYHIFFENLSGAETVAHIHGMGLHGTSGGVLHALPAGNPKVGTWIYSEAQEDDILDGKTYVNIHSTVAPGGEIRGQIVPLVIPVDGGQEVPVVATAAAGVGLFAFDTDADELSYDIRYGGLSSAETGAHIHGYAPVGVGAGVVHPLPLGTQKLGVWNYPTADEGSVLTGLTYVNIHSVNNGGGEIRGQIGNLPSSVVSVGQPAMLNVGLRAAPNPFGANTSIMFQLAREGFVSLDVVGVDGRLVRRIAHVRLQPGVHRLTWDGLDGGGRDVPNGIYFGILNTPEGKSVTRLARLR